MNPFHPPRDPCTVCHADDTESEYHVLECGHGFHFECVYMMVIHGRHYKCPNCRTEFTEDWFDGFGFFINREANARNETQLVQTRHSQLRGRWEQIKNGIDPDTGRQIRPQQDSPPPLIPANNPNEDAHGNWVVQVGPDMNVLDLLLESDMNTEPPRPSVYQGPSLIPDRRAVARRRQQQQQQLRQQQENVEADDEAEASNSD